MGYNHPSWLGPTGKTLHLGSASMGVNFVRLQGIVPAWITPPWALHVGLTGEAKDQSALLQGFSRKRGIKVLDFDVPPPCDPPVHWHVVNRHTRRLSLVQRKGWKGQQEDDQGGDGRQAIDQDVDQDILDLIPSTRRKQERRFLRDGGRVEIRGQQESWDDVFRLHWASRERKNLDPGGDALAQLIERIRTEPWAFSVVALASDGTALASGGFLEDGEGRVVYALGGQKRSAESGRASVAMLIEAMREARRRGMAEFDFGGSLDRGVDQFYAEFGALPHALTRWVYVPAWWKPMLSGACRVWTQPSPYFPRPSV
ncbi:MAG: GNAT family N-acetyltransferase [Bacteroidetes bacterium]|nr:GNAT family N-acetyltransferase [Bacteroidota bacterium]MDA0903674.1 GNAT family N-acetyltransferase [Bacteroidota bacterium]MDA1242572.1 GNAT family N-acetyltransferase [Bacteroidota bacterium]